MISPLSLISVVLIIEVVSETKLLGVIITENLKWGANTEYKRLSEDVELE